VYSGSHLPDPGFGPVRLFLRLLTEEQRLLSARYVLFNLKLAAFFRLAGPRLGLFGSSFGFARRGLGLGFASPGLDFYFSRRGLGLGLARPGLGMGSD